MKKIATLETNYMKQQEMQQRKNQKRKKLLFRRLTAFLILTVALTYLVCSSYISKTKLLEEMEREKAELKQTLAELQKQQAYLENEIVKLNDDEYIGKLARSEYFFSDEGEIVFTIPKDKKKEEEKNE